MKKILFLLSLSLLITGCTNNKTVSDNDKINELEQKIIELQDQQASTSNSLVSTTTPNIDTPAKKVETIKEKQTLKSPEIPQQPTTPTKSNDQICQDSYGLNSFWSGNTSNNGNIICNCKNGYSWNEQNTNCIITPIKIESPEIKIAKCEAEKTQQTQTYQQLESAMKQMTYQNTLKQLEEISPCGEAFYPDAISACREGQYAVARNAANDFYNQEHSKNLIKIQNNYINCLNQ